MPIELAYFTDASEMGGAEAYLMLLAERLDRSRFRPRLILPGDAALAPMVESAHAANLQVLRMERKAVSSASVLWTMFRHATPDLVHFNLPHPYACRLAIATARMAGVRAVVTTNHAPTMNPRSYTWRGRTLLHVVNGLVDVTIVGSEANHRLAMENYLLPSERLRTIHHGVDTERFCPHVVGGFVRREFLDSSGGLLVGTIGRLSPEKGHQYFINAANLVLQRFPDARFVIVGEGPLRETIEARIRSAGLGGRVILTGLRRDIPELLAALDIFVLTSIFEGLPLTLLEAMASGKPVVVPSIDGIPDAVDDGLTGLLVPPCNPERTAEAIIELLDQPSRRQEMGEAGRRRIEGAFTLERMIQDTEALYLNLCGE
ncbi:MAG: glycosyltransferase [Acidobacteria bacterium]|nr:glycosyltransferase [Acidobacteriota bacterium]